jgi:putative GTP pyrophosphokinase
MPTRTLSRTDERTVDRLVEHFVSNQDTFALILEQLRTHIAGSKRLSSHVHSMKWRVKDPPHLKDKLIRKLLGAKENGRVFDITTENLFSKINDLAGLRILHLHTHQMDEIDKNLKELLEEAQYPLIEGPIARTWDDESRSYFKKIGIDTKDSPSLYTSVHYVIETNTRTKYTCEIQLRTLMEEVWGEVDHVINYPHPSDNIACSEQIKVLARVTSSCSRLVDSIFKSHAASQQKAGDPEGPHRPRAAKKKPEAG